MPFRIELDEEFEIYKNKALGTAIYPSVGENSLKEISYLGLGLAGESGETVDIIKKLVRNDVEIYPGTTDHNAVRSKIKDELGDVFWYISGVMRFFDLELSEVLDGNLEKLAKRFSDNEIKAHD